MPPCVLWEFWRLDLVDELIKRLSAAGYMLSTAESCTGGLIASAITAKPGASEVFDRSFVTYSNEAKHEMLGVPLNMLEQHGAVSQPVAEAMAAGALEHSRAQFSIAVTGIAGPDGGSAEKPVGLVHVALAGDGVMRHQEHRFGPVSREDIRLKTIAAALALISDVVDAR